MNCKDRVPLGQGTEGTQPEHGLVPPCSLANIPLTPETQRDQERRIRREIANSNERRRMQSINAGFQSLKTLIPHTDGEKLSKVG